jgi:hypothetical protein
VGHLVVPRARNTVARLNLQPGQWAMDNGCFNGLDVRAFMRMLEDFHGQPGCRFVAVPDVVGDAAATARRWRFWAPIVRSCGWPLAFVAQNGITAGMVPWDEFTTLFVGGDDTFKESWQAASLCAYAKARGLAVHWGRVNSRRRYRLALESGADSLDGSGFSLWPDTNIPKAAQWKTDILTTPTLPLSLR